jgi:hypothetical protein
VRRPIALLALLLVAGAGLTALASGATLAAAEPAAPTGVTEGVGRFQRPVRASACGFVDRQGREAVPLRYAWVNWFEQGIAQVQVHRECPCLVASQWGLVDAAGREVIPIAHCFVSPASEGLVRVVYAEPSLEVRRFGFHALDGRVVLPELPYDRSHELWSEGLIGVRRAGRFGFIDHAGREVIPLRFESVHPFADGLAAAAIDGKWGFIDRSGRWVVPPVYDWVRPCSEGLCAVQEEGLWGFLDLAGKLVVPHRYLRVESTFVDGLAFVSRRLRADLPHFADGYIDRTGREYFDEPPPF